MEIVQEAEPLLSVIIPCYNVEDFLGKTLDSITLSYFPKDKLEVIMVDDESTDGTGDIMDEYAQRYSYMTAYHKPNGGVSAARNYGFDRAHGKYISYLDSDDQTVSNGWTKLVDAAEKNDAQIAVGFVWRYDSRRSKASFLHKKAVDHDIPVTTFKDTVEAPDDTASLLYDTTVWNKVYRHDFLKENNIRFIEGILYEDMPYALEAHIKATRISIIKDIVYRWQWRESANSITQSRSDLENYKSRLRVMDLSKKLIEEDPRLSSEDKEQIIFKLQLKIMKVDINIFIENIANATEEYRLRVMEITHDFMTRWGLLTDEAYQKLYPQLSMKNQIQAYAIKTGNLYLFKQYSYTKKFGKITRKHGKLVYSNPDVPSKANKFLQLKDALPVTQKISKVQYDENSDQLNIRGMLKIRDVPLYHSLFSNHNWHESLNFQFINTETGESRPIHNSCRKIKPIWKRVINRNSNWNLGGYEIQIPQFTQMITNLGIGTWKIAYQISYTDNNNIQFETEGYLASPIKSKLNKPSARYKKLTYEVDYSTNWHLLLKIIKTPRSNDIEQLVLTKLELTHSQLGSNITDDNNDLLRATIRTPRDLNVKGTLLRLGQPLLEGINPLEIKETNLVAEPNVKYYQLTFQLSDLLTSDYLDKSVHLILTDTKTNMRLKYLMQPSVLKSKAMGNRDYEIIISSDQDSSYLWFRYQLKAVFLTPQKLQANDQAELFTFTMQANWETTSFNLDDFKTLQFELLSIDKQHEYVASIYGHNLRVVKHSKQSTTYEINFSRLGLAPVASDKYDWFLKAYDGSGKEYRFPIMTTVESDDNTWSKFSDINDSIRKVKIRYTIYSTSKGYLRLKVTKPYYGVDRKKAWRSISYSILYPLMRLLPLNKNMWVFDSFWASKTNDSPRLISDYLNEHYPNKYKLIWLATDPGMQAPEGAKIVRKNTLAYWYAFARAKYLVENTNFPQAYAKRKGQIEVQTLHGTFMKTMGFDEPHFKNASKRVQNNFAKRNSRWDLLISPSPYMTKTAINAFNYQNKIVASGFPRNDELYINNNEQFINKTRAKLGIKTTDKVILYAPTYRNKGGYDLELNLEELKSKLPSNYKILVRLHYFVAHQAEIPSLNRFVINVSDYPNINDLYIISDALVTDYSSVMFDYAHLKKPMAFFAYDKDWYLDTENRGVYLNYDQEVPGPVVDTTAQLADELKDLDELVNRYADKLKDFHDKFAAYGNDGTATERVVKTTLDANLDISYQNTQIYTSLFGLKLQHLFHLKNFQSNLLNKLSNKLTKKNIIIFESFFGTQYSDNPKALYLYIKKHYPKYQLYWNVNRDNIAYFKENNIKYVTRFGYKGLLKQARAKYYITNVRRPFRWKKSNETTLMQTWHGTPLKTIGTDVELMNMPGNNVSNYHKQVVKDSMRWDYLLTPNPYSTDIMARAFRKDANQIMYTGSYPRNDILVNATKMQVDKIKKILGLDLGRKTILYAPTWRDNEFIKADVFTAQLHLDLDALHDKYPDVQILIRTHYMIANNLDLSKYADFVFNVSGYQDIAELYLVSDLLITDYSSVFFDYAILKRPIIFFAYDLDSYASETRGFYIPYQELVPGPIVQTNQELLSILGGYLNSWTPDEYYQSFNQKFNPMADGKATQRAAEMLLNGKGTVKEVTESVLENKVIRVPNGALYFPKDYDFTVEIQTDEVLSKIKFLEKSPIGYDELVVKKIKYLEPLTGSSTLKIGTPYYLVTFDNHDYWISGYSVLKENEID